VSGNGTVICGLRVTSNRYYYNLQMDWGDGSVPTNLQDFTFTGQTSLSATHTYTSPGQFVISYKWLNYDMVMNCSISSYIKTYTLTYEKSKLKSPYFRDNLKRPPNTLKRPPSKN
jgi:hypothetical protein